MNCPKCPTALDEGFLYVRGLGASLHWSTDGSVGFLSRTNLEQLPLDRLSRTSTGGQAVLPALRCPDCSLLVLMSARGKEDST